MQTLTDALSKKILSSWVHFHASAKKISKDPVKNLWKIETSQGQLIEANAVCVTLSARQTKELLKENSPSLCEKLSELRYESVVVVNLAYSGRTLDKIPAGFGFVTPQTEKRTVLACTFVDQKFENRAPKGQKLFRAFVGGAFGRTFLEKSDAEILNLVQKDLRELLGVEDRPLFSHIQRHSSAMVQYGVGHLDWFAEIRRLLRKNPGLYLAGASFGGVGIPDCVREAEEQATKMINYLFDSRISLGEGKG